jgi:hypothetical protein
VYKIKKQSIRNYFIERCAGGPKSKHFWPTIKPFILLISLLTNSSLMGLKINWSVSVLFSFIAFILGWLSSVFMFCEPMSLATFMKKLLNVSATSVWLFIILSFSHNFYYTSLP